GSERAQAAPLPSATRLGPCSGPCSFSHSPSAESPCSVCWPSGSGWRCAGSPGPSATARSASLAPQRTLSARPYLWPGGRLPDVTRSRGKSARILKSEAKQMKKDGGDDNDAGTSADTQQAPKTIQAAPGDVASSRPVSEPTNQQQNQS